MLAAGIQHPATEATLVNMFVDIVQALSATVLRMVVPVFQERLSNTTSPVELETYNTCLGDSLSATFAAALDVPQERSQSVRELTTLIENEVSERIRSVLSTATDSTFWPSDPALYVPPIMTNSSNLRRMVSHAFTCLKGLLRKMHSQCLGLCLRPKDMEVDRCESSQSINSDISVPSVTKAVSDILQKWSSETVSNTEEAETALVPLRDSLEAHDAASEIATMISEDLHHSDLGDITCCSERSSSGPHYNIRLALDKVRDFFAGQVIPSEDTIQVVHKRTFFKIARNQFQTIMAELKSAFQCKDADFVVSLKQDSSRSLLRIMEGAEEAEEVTLPGAIPDSPRTESKSTSRTTMTSFGDLSSPPVDFDTIKSDVDDLFNKLDLQAATCASNKPENVVLNEEIRKFSRELTDKMYNHLMAGQMYQIPILPMGRSLSDSVISERRFKVGTTRSNFSPEVLYAMTEDAVGKFCQLMLHWLEKEPSVKASYDEKVCGAFAEIDDLLTRSLTPTEEDNIWSDSLITQTSREVIVVRSESPEAPTSQESPETSETLTTTPSPTYQELPQGEVGQPNFLSGDFCDGLDLRLHVDSRILASQKVPQRETTPDLVWEQTEGFYPGTAASSSTLAPLCSKSSKGLSSSSRETQTSNLVSALVTRLIGRIPRKAKKDLRTDDINAIIHRVSEKAQEECIIMVPSNTKVKDVKKINKAVIKDLLQQYDSPKQLVEAAMATDDPSFAIAVVKYINIHLKTHVDPPPKKSKVARFFTAVGKALAKPFRLCFMDTSDD